MREGLSVFELRIKGNSYKNLPINFRAISLAILTGVVGNRRAGIEQYTPSAFIFALRFFGGNKA